MMRLRKSPAFGGTGGAPYDDFKNGHEGIVELTVHEGEYAATKLIAAIEVKYATQSEHDEPIVYGYRQAKKTKVLEAGQYLAGIRAVNSVHSVLGGNTYISSLEFRVITPETQWRAG